MHVEIEDIKDSSDRSDLKQLNSNVSRISVMLEGVNGNLSKENVDKYEDGETVFKKSGALFAERERIAKRCEQLEREIEQLKPWGEFDPNIHDAMSQEESDEFEEGKIIRIMRKGYLLNDRLIRPPHLLV